MTNISGSASSAEKKRSPYDPNGKKRGRDCTKERELIAADPDLGKISDAVMGQRYGVSKTVAWRVRTGKGVDTTHGRTNTKRNEKRVILEADERLGTMTDNDLSLLLTEEHQMTFHRSFVSKVRSQRGIKPFSGPGGFRKKRPGDGWMPTRACDLIIARQNEQIRKLMESWGCIPERVGLSPREWRGSLQ